MNLTPEELACLRGHPNAAAILEVLAEPVDAQDSNERKNGYVVGQGDYWLEGANEGDPLHTTHTLAHWQGGWDAEQFHKHEANAAKAKATHGLGFLQRPHGKGPYLRTGPKTRKLVLEAYAAQVALEDVAP